MNDSESQLAMLLGADALVTDAVSRERYLVDWTRTTSGSADAIVRPSDIADVARCVAWCSQNDVGIVPQGGHTGLVGGATPLVGQRQIVLSLERLNKVREVDPVSNTMTVEAGVVLQQIQEAADTHDRLFPLSLGAEGSCQIGGCISTNAGGTAVLRYGNTRDLVLGLEVVLPDGSIWSKLQGLRKDNAGFDLKQLFIGTEGTLGIVTAATLRLFPKPRQTIVAMAAVPSPTAVLDLFVRVRNAFDSELTAFELMTGECVDLTCRHLGRTAPIDVQTPFAVMLEISAPREGAYLTEALLQCLEDASDAGTITDAALASNQQQANFFWTMRESIPEAMLHAYGAQRAGHDISLPITRIPDFMHRAQEMIEARWAQLGTLVFGHVGDGNLHFNVMAREPLDTAEFRRIKTEASEAIYQLTNEFGGSISAEHGTGVHKRELLSRFSPPAHLALMHKLKAALDDRGLMNPGKVFLARGGSDAGQH